MATQQPSILFLGLKNPGPNAPFDEAGLAKLIEGEIENLKQAGYYAVDNMIANPENPDMESLKKLFHSRSWTAVSIGFGVRGQAQYTDLFEKLVNTANEEIRPQPKFLFNTQPNKVLEAAERVLGKN